MSSDSQTIDELKIVRQENAKCKAETTNITDLNTDCMEIVFEHLELIDLVNVSDSSKQFYSAACQVYQRMFQNVNPMFAQKRWYRSRRSAGVETDALEENLRIVIETPKDFLKLLRHFGHLIRNLQIDYNVSNAKVYVGIETYLANYCSDSVQRLSLTCSGSKIPFEHLQKPLNKVIALTITTTAQQPIPSQIRFLNENNLPNVQHIYFNNRFNQELHESDCNVHFENIESFIMHTSRMFSFPFSFGHSLKYFTIAGSVILNDAFCECISKIERLKILKMMSFHLFDLESFSKLLQLQNVVSNVVEIQFECHERISPEIVFRFLKQSQQLQKLSIHLEFVIKTNEEAIFKFDLLQAIPSNLHDEWKCSIKDPYQNPFGCSFDEYKCLVIERINT